MSTLMFWNKQNGANNQNNDQKTGKKNWLHTPDVLVNGHVAYPVKFLGSTPVDQPKGIEVVKEAIRRLQFSQQLKKAEGGNNVKTKKVELTVSINGIAIQKQENKVQVILHQFPLHKISYCADEKGSKKFFSFIAKAGAGSNNSNLNNSNGANTDNNTSETEVHECFVFISNKLASDITLTIGQAFDLAYRRYISESSKSGDNNTDLTKLQLQNKHLENSLVLYQQRLKELSEIVPKFEMDKILAKLFLKDICDLPQENGFEYESNISSLNSNSKSSDSGVGLDILSNTNNNDSDLLIETSPKNFAPLVPPRNFQNQLNSTLDALRPSVGTKLEGLLLNSDSDSDFDPRACESDKVPEPNTSIPGDNNNINDLFGFEPPKTVGQQLFTTQNGNQNSFNISNGSNGNSLLINGMPSSPPPLLAPPPKAAIPRRTITPNKQPNSQDLFGSTPFSPFDDTPINNFGSTDFAIDVSDAGDNPFKPMPTPVMNKNSGSVANIIPNCNSTPNFVLSDLSAFANNLDKLDTILIKTNYDNDEMNSINSNNQQNTSNSSISNLNGIKKLNPFHKTNPRSKSPSLNEMMIDKEPNTSGGTSNSSAVAANNNNNNSNNNNNNNTSSGGSQSSILSSPKKVNPFSRTDSFLNRNLKYDSFKNAIDSFETTMYSSNNINNLASTNNHSNHNKFGGGGLLTNNNNNNNNSNDDKLNFYSASLNFNEFSNRLIDSDLNHKNNFINTTTNNNNNNGLNFGTAFTLESLDPLRK